MSQAIQIAERVIAKSNRERPADGVLRTELKSARGISRNDGAAASEAVFAYYRWLGWLNPNAKVSEQIVEAVERDRDFQKKSDEISAPELQRAIPGWVKAEVKYSPEWLRALQLHPKLWLRAKLGTGRALAEKLGECWIGGERFPTDAISYEGREDLFRTAEFYAGEFELQDISSQAVGLVCNPQPNETWWDACAGEGGKALHLCDLMRGKGLLWASDRADWRLKKLKRRAARAKAFNYRAALWDGGAKLPTKTKFDGILVDAPCSGLGTWQRNPQARWTTTLKDVHELSALQEQLVANAIAALKPGGRLIYSVCTLTESETTRVADAIMKRFAELKPLNFLNPLTPDEPAAERLWLWPQTIQGNGMFICGWEKTRV
ncbi:MAG TPA: RsmB/NOP family class I SAM-dependent RNA methyltransferase [Verrucomicrobiae bacterium]|jgi:16S rRNA (cytosine967-C5)-methyltransferase|nr:RsmB/NOP family class I SAM-dependent RNA methyltransferase [Verrucomicrobiae bacterium]